MDLKKAYPWAIGCKGEDDSEVAQGLEEEITIN